MRGYSMDLLFWYAESIYWPILKIGQILFLHQWVSIQIVYWSQMTSRSTSDKSLDRCWDLFSLRPNARLSHTRMCLGPWGRGAGESGLNWCWGNSPLPAPACGTAYFGFWDLFWYQNFTRNRTISGKVARHAKMGHRETVFTDDDNCLFTQECFCLLSGNLVRLGW